MVPEGPVLSVVLSRSPLPCASAPYGLGAHRSVLKSALVAAATLVAARCRPMADADAYPNGGRTVVFMFHDRTRRNSHTRTVVWRRRRPGKRPWFANPGVVAVVAGLPGLALLAVPQLTGPHSAFASHGSVAPNRLDKQADNKNPKGQPADANRGA